VSGLRVLVCGSRDWKDERAIRERLERLPRGTTVIHGGARGADRTAGVLARGLGFAVEEYPADWSHGRRAGIMRNLEMLDTKPDLVLAFWKDASRGTGHVVTEALAREIDVEIFTA
jgi:hypothetical protein